MTWLSGGLALALLTAALGVLAQNAAAQTTGFEICIAAANCKAGVTGGLGGEFSFPQGVASDAAGNTYVADRDSNRIQKFDSSGNFLRTWGKDVIQSGKPGDTGAGFEICTVAANCKAGMTGGLGGELVSPYGVAVDAAGNVYVSTNQDHRIQKFDSSGNFLRTWGKDVIQSGQPGDTGTGFEICTVAASCKAGELGALGGELNAPLGISADTAGNVYVAENLGSRIQKFDFSGNFQRAWGKDVIQSGKPGDTGTGFEICTVAANCKGGEFGGLGGELTAPFGLATDGANNVYAADHGQRRIQKFDSSGNFLRTWGKDVIQSGQPGDTGTGFEICTVAANCKPGDFGSLGGELAARGVASDAAGNVYAAEGPPTGANRIEKFDSSGNFQRAWGKDVIQSGKPGDTGTGFEICIVAANCQAGTLGGGLGGEFSVPEGIAVDPVGNVYVSDVFAYRMHKFASGGSWQRAWGKDVVADAPILNSTNPASGSNENNPRSIGTAPAGTTVKLYTNSTCTSLVAATGTDSELASPGLQVSVPDNSTTTFYGTAETANSLSPCSASSVTYSEVTPPAAPTLTSTNPASGSNENNPRVIGSAPAGTTVRLYTNVTCTSAVAATGTNAQLASPGLQVGVPDNSTTTFYGTAQNANGTSACSSTSVTYSEVTPALIPPVINPPVTTIPTTSPTGQRAAAIKKCKKKFPKGPKRKKCIAKAKKLPI
jgi:NHL repeat-containing protein